jgi:membrane protein
MELGAWGMQTQAFFVLIKDSVKAWIDDDASSMSAAIAFYTAFSVAPLLVIVIAVAGFVWGQEIVQGEVLRQVASMVGRDAAGGVERLLSSSDQPGQSLVATVASIVVLAVGATRVFAELQLALDRIWKAPPAQKESSIWRAVRTRLLSLGLILVLAFLLLVSMVVSAALGALGEWTGKLLPGWEFLFQTLNTLAGMAIATVLFAMIYKLMPRADVAWRDVWVGAFVTAILFEIGKVLIALYVGKSSAISSIAAVGSLVVVLIWVYYAALVFLLGAEFTFLYARRHGSHKAFDPSASGHAAAV